MPVTSNQKRYLFYISQNYSYAILRPLQDEIRKRGSLCAWFLEGKEVNPDYLRQDEQHLLSIDDVVSYQPDVVFIPGNVVPAFVPGIKVGVFHGFNSGKLNRRGFEDHFNIRGCFDLYCTQGPNTTEKFLQLAKEHQHFSVKETGWPMLDPLFDSSDEQVNDTLSKASQAKKPTVLMCSTFSRNLTCAPILFDEVKRLSEQGKWHWLVQFHPKMPQEVIAKYKSLEGDNLTFIETDNIIPVLKQADVMLCDTSSVLMMFLMQARPVVTFNNIAPKDYMLNISDKAALEQSLEYALSYPKPLMEKIDQFIADTHPDTDGNAAQRILAACDEMLAGNNVPSKRKPLNLLRKFKMRKKLGYWKF